MSLRPSQKAIILNESERERPSRCGEPIYRSLAAKNASMSRENGMRHCCGSVPQFM